MARSPTTASNVQPYATERMASATPAAIHDARPSIEPPGCTPWVMDASRQPNSLAAVRATSWPW